MDIIHFVIYSIASALIFIICGYGLSFLILPKFLKYYSLPLSPYMGLFFFLIVGNLLYSTSNLPGNFYLPILFIIATSITLLIFLLFHKEFIEYLLNPIKNNFSLLILLTSIYFIISAPLLKVSENLFTISYINVDIILHCTVAKFIQNSFLNQPLLNYDGTFNFYLTGLFGSSLPTSIIASILHIEPYNVQTIVVNIFFIFSLPIIYIIAKDLVRFKKLHALLFIFLYSLNFNVIFILSNMHVAQIIGAGLFYLIIFLFLSFMTYQDLLGIIEYHKLIITMAILIFSLISIYSIYYPIIMVLFVSYTIILWFLNYPMIIIQVLKLLIFSNIIAFVINPFHFINLTKIIPYSVDAIVGTDKPILTPDYLLGLFPHFSSFYSSSNIDFFNTFISLPLIILFFYAINMMMKKEPIIGSFFLSISVFFILYYSFLVITELLSVGDFSGHGYKAYKLATYILPFILMIFIYMIDFQVAIKNSCFTSKILPGLFVSILIIGNIFGFLFIIEKYNNDSFTISADLKEIEIFEYNTTIDSINVIQINNIWEQMWIYYFFFLEKKIFLEEVGYYEVKDLKGNFTLSGKSGNHSSNITKIQIWNNNKYIISNNKES